MPDVHGWHHLSGDGSTCWFDRAGGEPDVLLEIQVDADPHGSSLSKIGVGVRHLDFQAVEGLDLAYVSEGDGMMLLDHSGVFWSAQDIGLEDSEALTRLIHRLATRQLND